MNRARLDLRLLRALLQRLGLKCQRAAVLRELALLEEQPEYEPQERERRDEAFERAADLAGRQREERAPADADRQVRERRNEPEHGEREPEQDSAIDATRDVGARFRHRAHAT